ncbi:MAG: methyltransferase domain-containing protein [Parcubacteria group bacterium]|nr:methyltransferase domain-containing protein [Parcubacteria group bacterium]
MRLSTTREVISKLLLHVGGRVLDLGAGSAKYKEMILQKASKYRSCDAVKGKNIDDICDVLNLQYPPESFDTIISTQVMEHVSNPYQMATEIYKVLKPGGKVIVTVPFLIPMHSDPDDYFRFTASGLSEIFKQSGFAIIESGHYGGFFMVLSEIIHFSWFNPYKHKSSRLMNFIEKTAKFLDKIFAAKTIYANSFVVAQKPLNTKY